MANGDYMMKMLKDNWFIVIACTSMLASWVTLNGKVGTTETNFLNHCIATVKYENAMQSTQLEVVAIKRDLVYLKERADKTEELSHEILKEIRK